MFYTKYCNRSNVYTVLHKITDKFIHVFWSDVMNQWKGAGENNRGVVYKKDEFEIPSDLLIAKMRLYLELSDPGVIYLTENELKILDVLLDDQDIKKYLDSNLD